MTSSGDPKRQTVGFGAGVHATARGRHGLLRVFFCAWPLVALPAHGAEAVDCDSLPESRRDLCVMVQACATVAEKAQRQECFRAAAESLGGDADASGEIVHDNEAVDDQPAAPGDDGEAQEVHAEASSARTPPAAVAPALETKVVEAMAEDEPTEAQATEVPVQSEAVATEAAPKRSRVARAFRELITAQRAADAPTLPRRFTAEVTAHHDLVRDRQLVVLDDALLFEGDRAASSRIAIGDEVEVVKSSSRRGRRYQITGPTKRPFDALRIRCERSELSVDNRRKCERMID